MATKGILDSLLGGSADEVQILAPATPPKPKQDTTNPFDIEKAKQGIGKFPPQPDLFINTERVSGHLTNIALAKLISPSGYTLQDVQDMWNTGDITDRGAYIVLTSGLLPPRETLRYVYSAEFLNTPLPAISKSPTDSDSVRYIELNQSFTVNVSPGFHVYVFCSSPSCVEGEDIPPEFSEGDVFVTLLVQRHSIGPVKADNSIDHTFSFCQRVEVWSKDVPAMPGGLLRFIARAEMVRV